MNTSHHLFYIAGSVAAAIFSAVGIIIHAPVLYGIVPGAIGALMLGLAMIRFFRDKRDLAGFVATACGFVFYQAYQANPIMLPQFTAYIFPIPLQDQIAGILSANLTAALLLIAYHATDKILGGVLEKAVPRVASVTRERCDGTMLAGFAVVFILVALPNAAFGKVVVGPINSIIYQRAAWTAEHGSYAVFGGAVGGSFANATYWAVSLFLLWLYLLRSRFRWLMWVLSPLVLIWTAAIAMQGSRTYLVTLAVALVVYLFGNPRVGTRALFYAGGGAVVVLALVQISAIFRDQGLQTFNLSDFSSHALEVQGNEGATSQMDGIEYFRTELLARGQVPNSLVGLARGLVERPIEGVLMVVPRSVFPWKPLDTSMEEFSLFYEHERIGVDTEEAFLGASPGLIGRELIHYGFTGPLTMLLWMGVVLALADRLFATGSTSDYHRICAAMLVAFFVAQARDFVAIWFLPFLPGAAVLVWVGLRCRRPIAPARHA